MKLEKLILFSDTLSKLLHQTRIALTVFLRAVLILLKWKKSLIVKTLQINEAFLLSNGLLLIKWRLKNFLWVKINNEILTINPNGILLHYNRIETPLKIKIIGLFAKHEEFFFIVHTATLESKDLKAPVISQNKLQLIEVNAPISTFTPTDFKPEFSNSILTKTLTTKIAIGHIQIPTFKKENYHA